MHMAAPMYQSEVGHDLKSPFVIIKIASFLNLFIFLNFLVYFSYIVSFHS